MGAFLEQRVRFSSEREGVVYTRALGEGRPGASSCRASPRRHRQGPDSTVVPYRILQYRNLGLATKITFLHAAAVAEKI